MANFVRSGKRGCATNGEHYLRYSLSGCNSSHIRAREPRVFEEADDSWDISSTNGNVLSLLISRRFVTLALTLTFLLASNGGPMRTTFRSYFHVNFLGVFIPADRTDRERWQHLCHPGNLK